MTKLYENVAPVFRRALANGKSKGGTWCKGQAGLTAEGVVFPLNAWEQAQDLGKYSTVSPL